MIFVLFGDADDQGPALSSLQPNNDSKTVCQDTGHEQRP